jgi:hypothetical protein
VSVREVMTFGDTSANFGTDSRAVARPKRSHPAAHFNWKLCPLRAVFSLSLSLIVHTISVLRAHCTHSLALTPPLRREPRVKGRRENVALLLTCKFISRPDMESFWRAVKMVFSNLAEKNMLFDFREMFRQ